MAAVGPGPVATREYVPGDAKETKTKVLESGASILQSFAPVNKIHQHLCAFHGYGHDMSRQVEAHHYCGHVNEDMRQCVIYDSDDANARLIGIEYIISEALFMGLPEEEKKLWHSHEYEVKSGILFCPGLPEMAEHAELAKVAKTYGKTFHFWQFDRGDALPLGPPQLMMSFTKDGQLHDKLAKDVEERYGVSFAAKKKKRADMKGPDLGIHSLADYWEKGKGFQTVVKEM
ncbi:hypothetical protein SELMODRAFT_161673 [Selaginella moellendorffii]|uniref:Uncharacterized protein n=1 Tax=Selaginella moellendorffii TaxID=88036 RepID=D8T776_SELML|nr:oil body-associated protein 1A [Selaginella moellendorffii]EFJ07571.1 hypothetical protein SELMODRAFT_161673 [Selaginella moellendorffii]|eukprot:XP_002991459.1 oil body-associated protein 1A [Selaginella moellendorffii]